MRKKPNKNSEFRAYPFILKSLEDLGWDIRNPLKNTSGQVFTQNEALYDHELKKYLGKARPENVVKINENIYWAIEAKAEHRDINKAVSEAQDSYAADINKSNKIKCLFATGVAGTEDQTFLVETYFFNGQKWNRVQINSFDTTGFITRDQALQIIETKSANIEDQDISEELFVKKANSINQILHEGAINKKNRARVIASLLLALVNDAYMKISDDPTTLIEDINARVKALLRTYGKQNFAQEIAISLPTSTDNHSKNRRALVECIQELRSINIKSAINSGSDLLGQFYEIFLKYANDSKEIGIVLTPRHITRFGADVINITDKDYVYDPTCGTGGFLVSALDKVKKSSPNKVDVFKKSCIFGMEQDPEVVGLALVNMIFRNDGNSNIYEGNCFDNYFLKINGEISKVKSGELSRLEKQGAKIERFLTKTLMNPPFAIKEEEYKFVDHALFQMVENGLLFAVLPTSTMSSSSDGRSEVAWRKNLLKRHTLKAVIKLSEDLFLPNAHKGTYAVVIEAWKPHNNQKVFWAVMDDGFTMKKAKRLPSDNLPSDIGIITDELKAFLILDKAPQEIQRKISYTEVDLSDDSMDCGPEAYLRDDINNNVDLFSNTANLFSCLLEQKKMANINIKNSKVFEAGVFIESITRGDCQPLNNLKSGLTPVVTTSEKNNGIDGYYEIKDATIFQDRITIPANGSKDRAFYHPYKFGAVPDILVCKLKPEFKSLESKLFICAMINQSSWRFSYFRKCTEQKLKKDIKIALPTKNGRIDFTAIDLMVKNTVGFDMVVKMLAQRSS